MHKIYKIFYFCVFIILHSQAHSSEQKIVYLNLDQIFQNSVPGSLILKELKDQNKKNIEKFKLKETDLRNQEQDLIKKKNILSKEEFDSNVVSFKKKNENF